MNQLKKKYLPITPHSLSLSQSNAKKLFHFSSLASFDSSILTFKTFSEPLRVQNFFIENPAKLPPRVAKSADPMTLQSADLLQLADPLPYAKRPSLHFVDEEKKPADKISVKEVKKSFILLE